MTIINPPPRQLPSEFQGNEYLTKLNETVFQLWFTSQGNKNNNIISATKEIDATQTGETLLFRTPQTSRFIPTGLIIKIFEFTAGAKATQAVADIGSNSPSFDDFLSALTVTVSGEDKYILRDGDQDSETPIVPKGTDFKLKITTASDATTEKWEIDLLGYLI